MEKYGVMQTVECVTCGVQLTVRNAITAPELEKLSHVTEGHIHVWKEVENGHAESGDFRPE